jgi:hypothetical protein
LFNSVPDAIVFHLRNQDVALPAQHPSDLAGAFHPLFMVVVKARSFAFSLADQAQPALPLQ